MDRPDESPDAAALRALQPGIRRPWVPPGYTAGLALVAVAMVLLPLVYLGLVGAVGYAVYWHATEHLRWLSSGPGGIRFAVVKLFVYAAILIVGLIVLFFLLKPLFARRSRRAQPLALHPGAEPRLYAFIEAVCRAVGAPRPRRIDLDARLNASASFHRGWWSFLGGDLVLTLGLPLAANLRADELAGVVAHEFGHFTQGTAMRLGYVIHGVNSWFARVVYERDAWDERLSEWSQDPEDWQVALVVWTAQIGVGLSRGVLGLLMRIGVGLSGFLSRQMEFHADRCQIRLAGSGNFERTTRKLATLGAALEASQHVLADGWRKSGRLPEDLPGLIRRLHERLPEPVVQRIHDTFGLETTRWHDTHPCPAQRIQAARRANEPGILEDERPATDLFENFDIPARQVTELFYTDVLELPVGPDSLVPLPEEDTAAGTAAAVSPRRSHRGLVAPPMDDSLLLGAAELLLPLTLNSLDLATPAENDASEDTASELRELVASLESVRPRLGELVGEARRSAASGDADPARLRQELEAMRHAVREVVDATGRRLELGLRLARGSLDLGSDQTPDLQRGYDWLMAARDEFPRCTELSARLAHVIARAAAETLHGDPAPELQAAIETLRTECAGLTLVALVEPAGGAGIRRLRVGRGADLLGELERHQRDLAARTASYRHALTMLWAVAGVAEQRLPPPAPSE